MSAQAFEFICVGVGLLLVLSLPRFPGAMIGFFCAMTVAFFIAPASFGLSAILRRCGLRLDPKAIAWSLLGLWLAIAAWRAGFALSTWQAGNADIARLVGSKALLMLALPLIGLVSVRSMAKAWP